MERSFVQSYVFSNPLGAVGTFTDVISTFQLNENLFLKKVIGACSVFDSGSGLNIVVPYFELLLDNGQATSSPVKRETLGGIASIDQRIILATADQKINISLPKFQMFAVNVYQLSFRCRFQVTTSPAELLQVNVSLYYERT